MVEWKNGDFFMNGLKKKNKKNKKKNIIKNYITTVHMLGGLRGTGKSLPEPQRRV